MDRFLGSWERSKSFLLKCIPCIQWEDLQIRQGALHHYILSSMAMLGLFLEVKQAAGSKSPFVTDHLTILTFIVVFFIYIGSLATVNKMRPPIPHLAEFMNNISLLFGSLALMLILLILFRPFGWFTLCLWTIYFVRDIVTKESYMTTFDYVKGRVEEFLKGQEDMETTESVEQTQDVGEQNVDVNRMEKLIVVQDAEEDEEVNTVEEPDVEGNTMEKPIVVQQKVAEEEYTMEEPNVEGNTMELRIVVHVQDAEEENKMEEQSGQS